MVGPSGGGKTTLCNLIARFWDVQGGRIIVGGHDVREYKLDSLMKNISMVFQSVYLFNDTVENNIKFGRPTATHEQVVAAAKAACCHDFITALPDGYDTVLGEGGGSLSGGEKQRISIARAMLTDPAILVLDEATAGLDPIVRDEILELFNEFTRDETHSVLISSHILSDLEKLCDYIAFLHQGRLLFCEEKDALLEQYGIFNDTAEQAEALMPEAIVSMETTPYGGVRALVRRELAPVGFQLEKPTIEDIILALVKGEKQ